MYNLTWLTLGRSSVVFLTFSAFTACALFVRVSVVVGRAVFGLFG